MKIKTIVVLLIFAVTIVGIIAPVSAAVESFNEENKVYNVESKEKTAVCKIRWDANGGTIGNKKIMETDVKKGSKITRLPTTPKLSGYSFKGWYTKKSGGTRISTNTKINKNVILYAQWQSNVHTLKFDANGGFVTTTSKKIANKKVIGTLATPTRSGHTFNGWYTKKSGGTKVTVETKPTQSTTYYAQWKKIKPIEIVGDATFMVNTRKALDVIKQSPKDYELVTSYIDRIKQSTSSGMAAYENPPTFYVGDSTSTYSTTWYATCIVHDAYHSKLYHDYLATHKTVPYNVWGNYTAEMKCVEVQISFQSVIRAPQHEIDHSISMRGQNWWDQPRTW
ncbi:MAG: InlB B-repeat-containing protein [Methanobrevibacter sp.]|nr:InlB B-repeat-containing protein [Methanobrevibacter sp.]